MLNPGATENLKSVALSLLIQVISILELHNLLFLRIYTTEFLSAAVNWLPLPRLKENE